MVCADPTESFSMRAGIITAFGTGLEGTAGVPGFTSDPGSFTPPWLKGRQTRGVTALFLLETTLITDLSAVSGTWLL